MPLPDSVADLIARFEANRSEYHKGHYNETQTRIDYVNPLFAALGWDMDNRDGLSELLREVVHEDAIKIGGTTKAPDYSFRIAGARKFFVETKKPTVNLFLTGAPAFQLRRYAWTVKMPLSILTNFEEFAVYDTRVPPDKKDAAKKARLDYFKYTDYADKWDEIAARFSHEAVLSGAFDRYAEQARDKRISVPVDVAFLAEISGWREKLARNIVQNNSGLGPRELNYAVQMIIDRLIFLRISEDRGVEPDFLLQPLMNKGGPVYPRLLDIFHRADARYNSGLFHFKTEPGREGPDDVTPRLTIDDRPLREIIASVYYPESPFEFSVFPADILGQVYEQFLGKVIHVSGQTAEVEDKPEVKKAGGVYYTPTYIVDYIVRNTVGKLIDGKTPTQIAKLTVLDPACGSGSFLIGAYQFLLDWHLKYYTENDRAKWAKGRNATIYQFRKDAGGGELWRLTTAEKKRILLANLYGVDIDTQAVEVTKLSLLLKVLEGESAELIDNTLKLLQERALPDLENNIKCGNSLIGPDFYADKKPEDFDLNARLKLNAFDWKSAFPKVMAGGGFDAVIGNPPYVLLQNMNQPASFIYLAEHFRTAKYKIDTYHVFYETAVNLTRDSGYVGYITPNSFLRNRHALELRTLILEQSEVEVLRLFYYKVFHNASVDTAIIILRKFKPKTSHEVRVMRSDKLLEEGSARSQKQALWAEHKDKEFSLSSGDQADTLLKKLNANSNLGAFATAYFGIQTFDRKKFVADAQVGDHFKPAIDGANITRFALLPFSDFVDFRPEAIKSGGKQTVYENARVGVRQIGQVPVATLIPPGIYSLNTIYNVYIAKPTGYSLHFVLGLLESRMIQWNCLYSRIGERRLVDLFAQVKLSKLKQPYFLLPVPPIDFSNPAEKAKHDKNGQRWWSSMLKLHKDKAGARLAQEKAILQQQIEATDAQIDRLVYDLYGLTEDEIKIVEAAG